MQQVNVPEMVMRQSMGAWLRTWRDKTMNTHWSENDELHLLREMQYESMGVLL